MYKLIHGDCLDVLRTLDANSVDSLVTDPPAGISFMGKNWDGDKGGREAWVYWMRSILSECLRVMKPGAHGFVWAIPRTSHWTATACEESGFEIRDVVTHLYGQGFPKSLNISKAIDKEMGIKEWKETTPNPAWRAGNGPDAKTSTGWAKPQRPPKPVVETSDAKKYQGWGTALKPASEHWILVRKPLSEKTVAKNILKWGVGGINIDASRIGNQSMTSGGSIPDIRANNYENSAGKDRLQTETIMKQGRFPANLMLSHNEDCVENGNRLVGSGSGSGYNFKESNQDNPTHVTKNIKSGVHYGTETVLSFQCTEGCAVSELDRQSGPCKTGALTGQPRVENKTYGKAGATLGTPRFYQPDAPSGASRFFYVAKASKRDKNAGCEGLPLVKGGSMNGEETRPDRPTNHPYNQNNHPTVKSTRLMHYLVNMISPPNGVVLDPFLGSGSTGVSAIEGGFNFIGIEREMEYLNIGEARCKHAETKRMGH